MLKKQNKKFQTENNILNSPKAGQCNSLKIALFIAATTISCELRSQENKNKVKIIDIKNK